MRDIINAHMRLERAILHGEHQSNSIYGDDSAFSFDLDNAGLEGSLTVSSARSRIRYMAALFPNKSVQEICVTISDILQGAKDLTASDVRSIVLGRDLNTGHRTEEVDIERIQMTGKLLADGVCKTKISALAGVSRDTVQAIDWYLGISDALDQRRVALACDMIRDGVSSRLGASRLGVSKSQAHRYMVRARKVLLELGEVTV